MNVVVDDHLLREILLDAEPEWLRLSREPTGTISTTGCWYYRLCRAFQGPELAGRLSGPLTELPADLRLGVVSRAMQLPPEISMRSLREVSWKASELAASHGLNLLAAEALASAIDARAALAGDASLLGSRLAAAAASEGVAVLVDPDSSPR